MPNTNTIQLRLIVKDDGSVVIDQAAGKIEQFGKKNQRAAQASTSAWGKVKSYWLEIAAAIYTVSKAFDYMDMAAKAEQAETAFHNAAQSYSVDADKMLAAMKRASSGTIDDSDLMQKALKAMAQGIDPHKIPAMFEAARIGAVNMGTDVKTAADIIIDAVANKMPRGLRQLGLISTKEGAALEKAMADGAEGVDLLGLALFNAAKQNAILKVETNNSAITLQRFYAVITELKEQVGKGLLKVFGDLIQKIDDLAQNGTLEDWGKGVGQVLKDLMWSAGKVAEVLDKIFAITKKAQIEELERKLEGIKTDKKVIETWSKIPVLGLLANKEQELARYNGEIMAIETKLKSLRAPSIPKPQTPPEKSAFPSLGEAAAGWPGLPDTGKGTKALEDANNITDAINKQIEALRLEAETYAMTTKEATLYKMALDKATPAQLKQASSILNTLSAQEALNEFYDDLEEQIEKEKQATEAIDKQIEALRLEAETYGMTAQQIELYKMKLAGATDEQLKQASAVLNTISAQKALDDFYADIEGTANQTVTVWGAAVDAIDQSLQSGLFDSFKDGVGGIKDIWREMCDTLVTTFLRAMEQMAINELLYGSISGKGSGGATGGVMGWLKGIFGGDKKTGANTAGSAGGTEDLFNSLMGKLTDFFSSFFSKIQGWFSSLLSGLFGGGSGFSFGGILSSIGGIFRFADGGWISEPVLGRGVNSGRYYSFAEKESERVMTKKDIRNINNNYSSQSSNQRPVLNARIINVLDPSIVGDFLGTNSGEQIIMNIVKRNQGALMH